MSEKCYIYGQECKGKMGLKQHKYEEPKLRDFKVIQIQDKKHEASQ